MSKAKKNCISEAVFSDFKSWSWIGETGKEGISHHKEQIDLLPANIELSALEVTMSNVMSRELIMKEYIDTMRSRYDYILIDCMPSLGMMTINALVASDMVLIPVQAAYLPVKGLQQLITGLFLW